MRSVHNPYEGFNLDQLNIHNNQFSHLNPSQPITVQRARTTEDRHPVAENHWSGVWCSRSTWREPGFEWVSWGFMGIRRSSKNAKESDVWVWYGYMVVKTVVCWPRIADMAGLTHPVILHIFAPLKLHYTDSILFLEVEPRTSGSAVRFPKTAESRWIISKLLCPKIIHCFVTSFRTTFRWSTQCSCNGRSACTHAGGRSPGHPSGRSWFLGDTFQRRFPATNSLDIIFAYAYWYNIIYI